MSYQLTCVVCGKPFEDFMPNKKTCCLDCAKKHKLNLRINRQLVSDTKVCEICGKPFNPSSKTHKYCSAGCRAERAKRISNEYYNSVVKPSKKVHTRTCKRCGKKFETTNNYQFYCSDVCQFKRKLPPVRNCQHCGKIFIVTNENRKYCSDKCCDAYNYEKYKKFVQAARADYNANNPLTCPVCGTKFNRQYKNHKYCSDKCKYEAIKIKKADKYVVNKIVSKKCKACGKEFIKRGNNQNYCSDKCSDKYHKMVNENKEKTVRICKVCGNKFTVSTYNRVYCSDDCKRKGEKIVNSKYFKNWKKEKTKIYKHDHDLSHKENRKRKTSYEFKHSFSIERKPTEMMHGTKSGIVNLHGKIKGTNKMVVDYLREQGFKFWYDADLKDGVNYIESIRKTSKNQWFVIVAYFERFFYAK